MAAPAKPCVKARCPHTRPCPVHPERQAFESATPRRRYGINGWDWQRTVQRVINRDGGRCQLQLVGCTHRATTADHIVSPRRGGTDHEMNLRAACTSCNEARRRQQARDGRAVARR